MFGFNKHKPRERFYLFPGQGGRSYRRKQRRLILSAVIVSLIVGAMLAAVLVWLAKPHP